MGTDLAYCKHCNEEHPVSKEFWYFQSRFKLCKKRHKDYNQANKERRRLLKRAWNEKNCEAKLAYSRLHYAKNKEKLREAERLRYHKDPKKFLERAKKYRESLPEDVRKQRVKESGKKYRAKMPKDRPKKYYPPKYSKSSKEQIKLAKLLRTRLYHALKEGYRAGSAVRDLGCSLEEFKLYIESKFQPGMSWDNWTIDGWHLDHIVPLSALDLTDREQFLKACHYTNLQPLWAKDNLSKGNRSNVP